MRPSLALRRRFDMLLLLTGEASADELDRFIAASVTTAAGPAAAEVSGLWQRYLALQHHPFVNAAAPDRPETWAPALAEHQRVRRELLGIEAADAFYRDDEAAVYARIVTVAQAGAAPTTAADGGAAPAVSGGVIDRTALSADARQRLDDELTAQARWSDRLRAAQAQVAALQAAAELSPVQRDAAIERWLGEHFDAGELRRVRGLLAADSR